MKPGFLSGFLMMVLGGALAVAAAFFLPHCGGDKPMRCVWMLHAVCGAGFSVALLGVAMQFVGRGIAMGLQIANAVNGLLILALSTVLIGACPNPMMKCHTISEPILVVWSLIIVVAALLDLWRLSRQH